jgi:hypothetical protein
MGGGFTEQERKRVEAYVADTVKNGSSAEKARPAAAVRQRRTPTSPRAASREKKADQWAEWFYRAMRKSGTEHPAALLPDMCGRLEELTATKIAEEVAPLRRRVVELELRGKDLACWCTPKPSRRFAAQARQRVSRFSSLILS